MDRLADLATSIERDPVDVARQALELANAARQAHDWRSLTRAQTVLGRARRMVGEIDLAEPPLEEAIDAATRIGDDELAADAHLALAGVLSIAGRSAQAFEHLDEVERLGSNELRSASELQRAVLCRVVGRIDEAVRLFDLSIPRLRNESRWLDLARVLANRGGIRMTAGDVAGSIADYEEAGALFHSVGQEFAAAQVHHNLGCAVANLGDLPRAMRLFDEASARFVELGHDASVPLLSRAEALLLAGLSADALPFSQDAARRLRAEGNYSAAAQALVAAAEAARLEGDYTVALDAARRAQQWFAADHSVGWQRAAELEAMRARHERGGLESSAIDRLEELADSLAAAGDVRDEIHARCLATVAACQGGRLDVARRQAALAATMAKGSRLLQTRLAAHHATATCRLANGDVSGARRELRRALDALEETRLLRGTGDAGTAVVAQARAVTKLSVRMAAIETMPMQALAWMERARLAAVLARPALPPKSDEVAAQFARLRAAASDLRHAELAGEPTAELRHRHAELEQSMREHWLTTGEGAEQVRLPGLEALGHVIGDDAVVSIAADDDQLLAVVAVRERARICPLGPVAHALHSAQRASSSLRGIAVADGAPAVLAARRRTFDAAINALDAVLLAPLQLDAPHVVLVVPAELHAIPWAALPSLRERSFTLAPSVRWWIDAASSPFAAPRSALVVAGPRLAEAEAEAREVAACHRRATTLIGERASTAAVRASLASHDVVHLVAHGHFRHDNPLWSTIELADGLLTVYELERLGAVPPTVILASCESGLSGSRGGAQLHGLAATLLLMGARTIVAAIGALPDDAETRRTMVALHRDLADGRRASRSLAGQRTPTNDGLSLTAAGLVTLGVG